MIVAIDGPAGSGKGTISKKLAEYFNLSYLDTGILYRAVALQMLTEGINEKDFRSAKKVARQVSITSIDHNAIRTRAVSDLASKIATISSVYVKSCLPAKEDLHKTLIQIRTELF